MDWDSTLYSDKHSFVFKHGENLLELLDPKPNEYILDLGCGTGELTNKISYHSKETVGIDKSSQMIQKAQENFPHINFHTKDATSFSFEKKFDAIFSNATLHWVLDYKSCIRCMRDNLKPNGKIVLEFGGKGNVQNIIQETKKVLSSKGYLKQSKADIWFFPSIGEYSLALEQEGFRVLYAKHFDRPTKLLDKKSGIVDWLTMFGNSFFEDVDKLEINNIKFEIQNNLTSKCFINDSWLADYKRLQIIAIKT